MGPRPCPTHGWYLGRVHHLEVNNDTASAKYEYIYSCTEPYGQARHHLRQVPAGVSPIACVPGMLAAKHTWQGIPSWIRVFQFVVLVVFACVSGFSVCNAKELQCSLCAGLAY